MKKLSLLFALAIILGIACQKGPTDRMVLLETPQGKMKIKLYNSTPKHRDNFIKLVGEGFYNDLLFHRVINQFMIQGGDPNSRNSPPGQMLGAGDPSYTLEHEIGALHFKGALSAARTGDQINPQKRSSGSQFYIVQGQKMDANQIQHIGKSKNIIYTPEQIKRYETIGGTPFLDGEYTVFGEVVEGLEIIDQLAVAVCDQNNRPLQDIKMKISILK